MYLLARPKSIMYTWKLEFFNKSYFVGTFTHSHEEIIWLDIPVKEMSWMDVFDTFDHHIKKHQNGFLGEFSVTYREQIFKWWAEKVHDHDVVFTFCETIVSFRDSEIRQLHVTLDG